MNVKEGSEYIFVFSIDREPGAINVDVWSNTIVNQEGQPIYRLVAVSFAPESADDQMTEVTALHDK